MFKVFDYLLEPETKTLKDGIEFIKKWEGLKLEAYIPVKGDRWTIGWGNTFIDGYPVRQGMKITKEQADKYLIETLLEKEEQIQKLLEVELKQNQWDALISFFYNVGQTNFANSTLRRLVNKGEFEEAADQFDKWIYVKKRVVTGLIRRRKEEKSLFLL